MLDIEPLTLSQDSRELFEQFVPENHPLRKMDEAIDFSFILPLVAHRYDRWIGRRAKHPERMWRLLFAQYHLDPSDEEIILAAHESLALRLFFRLDKDEKPPHSTSLGKFRFRRLDVALYLKIHFALLEQAEEKGLLGKEERQIFDTSHVRSNTKVVSIAYLSLQARLKVIREAKKIDSCAFTKQTAFDILSVDRVGFGSA